MKRFRVMENGREVWCQSFGRCVEKCAITNNFYDYLRNEYFFERLMAVIGNILEDVDLVLDITKEEARIVLYLKNTELPLAEDIRFALLQEFPYEIEHVTLIKNELIIMDSFFQHRD